MNLDSMAGFAVVFVVCAWTLSAIGGLLLSGARAPLLRFGPMAERRAASAAAIVPVTLAAVAVGVLVVQSLVGIDHCPAHDHHAHLCLVHGAQWVERTWVLVLLAVAGAAMLGRVVLVIANFVRGARSIRDLHALSREAGDVRIVESDRAFCFVANKRGPAIYVSSRAWEALSAAERAALVAHETAHVHQKDLRARMVIEALLVFAAPLVGDLVRNVWLQASERLCDARAARVTGQPDAVASAMVSLCRLQASRPVGSLGFPPAAAEVAGRVHAVLAGGPTGERAAMILGRVVSVTSLGLVILAVVAAEPLHHVFETLLG